ncbi:hypothetical protein B0H19DRAFT_1317643 [Mycena capillaripes]|nr:hypothetical protein B0H19DRAFT_1317643 [Mycena capillaripes]
MRRAAGDGRLAHLALEVCLPARTLLRCYRTDGTQSVLAGVGRGSPVPRIRVGNVNCEIDVGISGRKPTVHRGKLNHAGEGGKTEESATAPERESGAIWCAFKRASNGEQSGEIKKKRRGVSQQRTVACVVQTLDMYSVGEGHIEEEKWGEKERSDGKEEDEVGREWKYALRQAGDPVVAAVLVKVMHKHCGARRSMDTVAWARRRRGARGGVRGERRGWEMVVMTWPTCRGRRRHTCANKRVAWGRGGRAGQRRILFRVRLVGSSIIGRLNWDFEGRGIWVWGIDLGGRQGPKPTSKQTFSRGESEARSGWIWLGSEKKAHFAALHSRGDFWEFEGSNYRGEEVVSTV